MNLNKYIDTMLKTTPTAYIIYQKVKNSYNKIIDYNTIDYNPAFLKVIGVKDVPYKESNFKNFILNLESEFPKVKESIDKSQHKQIVAYSHIYGKWLSVYLFYLDGDRIIVQIADTTKEKKLEKKLRKKSQELQIIMNVINDLVLVIDPEQKIYLANISCGKSLEYYHSDLIGKNILDFLLPESYNKIISSFENRTLSHSNNIVRTKLSSKDGKELDIEWNCSIYEGYIFLVGRDITDIIKTQEKILYLSYHDTLTDVYNRLFFEEELKRLDNGRNLPLSIIMGDVDGLKITNDVFGHLRGDKLLKDIAKILKMSIRKGDILSRWGGDEFIILLPSTDKNTTNEIIQRISRNTEKLDSTLDYASISLGFAVKTLPEQNIYTILTAAENNMYKNKTKKGKAFRKKIISLLVDSLHSEKYKLRSSIEKMKIYLKKLSEILELSQYERDKLLLLADIHDIGLISVPKDIMNKLEPLDESDWDEIKEHAETGYRIAKAIPEISSVADNILYHHERYDGKGYPYGLKGKEIPYLNRIFSIVDVYESLSQNKIYRTSFSQDEVLEFMVKNRGTMFDPLILDLFLNILEEANLPESK